MILSELKKRINQALAANDLDQIVALAQEDRRALNLLIGASYDKHSVESWRAITAMGLAAQALVAEHYDFLRETARRLLWSITDESGAIGWSAPEMLGEIISAAPDRFADLIPILASYYDEEIFRPGAMYGLWKISAAAPQAVAPFKELITKGLSDENPLVRLYSLYLVQQMKLKEALPLIKQMSSDGAKVQIYKNDRLETIAVGTLAQKVSESL